MRTELYAQGVEHGVKVGIQFAVYEFLNHLRFIENYDEIVLSATNELIKKYNE